MSLRHAILTALLERPSSGFDLARRFDRSIKYFWSSTHQQIYKELQKLESDGFIKSIPVPPSRGQRKPYEVLPQGRSELISWVERYEGPRPNRDPLLVRLRAATMVGLGTLVEQMKGHFEEHQRQRDEYLEIAKRDFKNRELDEVGAMQYLILKAGIGLEEYWMGWLEMAMSELEPASPTGSVDRESVDVLGLGPRNHG